MIPPSRSSPHTSAAGAAGSALKGPPDGLIPGRNPVDVARLAAMGPSSPSAALPSPEWRRPEIPGDKSDSQDKQIPEAQNGRRTKSLTALDKTD